MPNVKKSSSKIEEEKVPDDNNPLFFSMGDLPLNSDQEEQKNETYIPVVE